MTLPTLRTFDQTAGADAEERLTITEKDQDAVSFFYCPCILQLIVCIVGVSLPRGKAFPRIPYTASGGNERLEARVGGDEGTGPHRGRRSRESRH